MKKLRVGALVCVLILVSSFAVYTPQQLQQLLYQIVGIERVHALASRFESTPTVPVDADGAPKVTTARDLLQSYKSKLLLKPDHRFTLAAEQLFAFMSGQAEIPAELRWQDERWHVNIDGTQAGSLPAFSSFRRGRDFVEAWLLQLNKRYQSNIVAADNADHRLIAGVDGFNPRILTSKLADLNSGWRDQNPNGNLIHEAVVAMSRLALVSENSLIYSDDIIARALAMTVLAKSVNPEIDYREYESQVAYAMGYQSDARVLAQDLDVANLWRMYLFGQDKKLIATVKSGPSVGPAKYYLLRRLAEQGYTSAWYNFLYQYYSDDVAPFHALMTGYELNDWSTFRNLSYSIPLVVVEHAGGNRVWKKIGAKVVPLLPKAEEKNLGKIFAYILKLQGEGIGDTYRQFDLNLSDRKHLYSGVFLNADAWHQLQQNFFQTAVYKYAECAIDCSKRSVTGKNFANELGLVDSHEARLLGYYFELLALANDSKLDKAEVVEAIDSLKVFGAKPLFRLFDEIKHELGVVSPETKEMLHQIVATMDSRIDDRNNFALAMHDYLLNLSTAHLAYQTIKRDRPESGILDQIWLARYFEQFDDIAKILHRRGNSESEVKAAIAILGTDQIDALNIDYLFTELLAKFPASWEIRQIYVDALERAGRYRDARRQIVDWIRLDVDKTPQDLLQAKVYLARSFRFEQKFDKAMDLLAPTLINDFEWGHHEATQISNLTGNFVEAVKYAETARAHFPKSRYSAENLLLAYWSAGEFEKAAELIAAGSPYTEHYWHRTLGRIYANIFNTNSDAGVKAFDALLDTNIKHHNLLFFTRGLSELGNHELSFRTIEKLFFPGPGIVSYKLKAYAALKSWRGEETALTWLREQVPEKWINGSSKRIFHAKHYDLLWRFISRPELGDNPDEVWLVRAAAHVLDAKPDPLLYQQLLDYYSASEHDSFNDELGRMVLGLLSEDVLVDAENNLFKVSEVAFFKGVHELGNGNYYLAADWFKAVLETGVSHSAEFDWVQDRLSVWMRRAKAIELQLVVNNSEFGQSISH